MKRNLLLCCDKGNFEKYKGRIKNAFGDSVSLTNDPGKADLIYVMGEISPSMRERMEEYREMGIKMVEVNENLVNQDIYQSIHSYRAKNMERGR